MYDLQLTEAELRVMIAMLKFEHYEARADGDDERKAVIELILAKLGVPKEAV